jgi:hypothetical protein
MNFSEKILALGVVILLASGTVEARSGSNYWNDHHCGDDTGSSTNCDSWEGALNYDMYSESTNSENIDEGMSTSGSTVVVDGVGIEVSGWSDTGNYNGHSGMKYDTNSGYEYRDTGEELEDNTVQSASIAGPWENNSETGYGISNDDGDYYSSGDYGSIDNLASDSGTVDYDMVLFSFSEAVNISAATFSWIGDTDNTEVSIIGLSDISALTSGTATWETIASSVSDSLQGSFVVENCDDVYYSDFTSITGTAQYWLIGAYNTVFGYIDGATQNDDSIKLASIGFTTEPDANASPATPVNAPSSFAFILLTGAFAAWRRKAN